MAHPTPSSPFYVPVDLSHTALLLADIQTQIASRFPKETLEHYLSEVLPLLELFRAEILRRRSVQTPASTPSSYDLYDSVPLIVHHVFPAGINSNGFISPYNKLAAWFHKLEASGAFSAALTDPNHPQYAVLHQLLPPTGWGSKDEVLISKLTAGCLSSSELQQYLRARGIRHVILCGLTTSGAILGSARLAADIDFHVIVPREGVMDDEADVNDFLLDRVLPRFVDVVNIEDVKDLFKRPLVG